MKHIYKLLAYLLVISCIFNSSAVVLAQNNDIVKNFKFDGETITVEGSGEDVKIILLNPGKTVNDLNAADTIEEINETVNYMDNINVGVSADYTKSFKINDFDLNSTYTLYVKDKNGEYSRDVEYSAVRVYVSADAIEKGDGTEEKPYATIEEARDAVRSMPKTVPIEVIIGGGTYNVSSAITFGANDSGTETAPITYKAKAGEKVILNGSTKIDISKVKTVTDGNVLGRVNATAADKLVEIDLEEQGIPYNVVNFDVNHTVAYTGKPMGVYLNGVYQTIARWPNTGYATTNNVQNGEGLASFKIVELEEARAQKWAAAKDMYVEGYLAYNWCEEWAKVGSVENNVITLQNPAGYGVMNGRRVAAVNLLEEIDMPGEWYADKETMKLYYYPPYVLTQSDNLEIATLCENLVSVIGADYINFEGIQFTQNANSPEYYADNFQAGNGMLIREASNVNVSECTFKNIGMDGIFVLFSEKVNIDSCKISDTGFRGIYVKNCGDYKTLKESDIVISNCYVSKVSRDSGKNDSAGIYITESCVGVEISNNIISNIKNSAIRYAGNKHTIQNNEIYNCANETSDAGAIYAGRSFTEYGTTIKNNYFHQIGQGIDSYMASAVFWDDNHSGNTFVGNIVDMNNMTYSSGVTIGGGRDNVVKGNIFVNAAYGVYGADRVIDFPAAGKETNEGSFYNGTLFQSFKRAAADTVTNAYYITEDDWLDVYKAAFGKIMVNFDELMAKKYSRVEQITDNVLYNCNISTEQNMTADSSISANKTITDTNMFKDFAGGDYRIKSEYKQSLGLSDDVLTDSFLGSNIGIQSALSLSDEDKNFSLVYPMNNSSVSAGSLYLKWNAAGFADKYRYEIATDNEFQQQDIVKTGETLENCVYVSGLENGKTYYWRVFAVNTSKQMPYEVRCSQVFTFNTSASLWIDNVKYDSTNKVISLKVSNETSAENLKAVVALKNSQGKLVAVRTQDVPITKNYNQPRSVSTAFVEQGTVLEFYVWDGVSSLKPAAVKFSF